MSGRKGVSKHPVIPKTRENSQLWALLYLSRWSLHKVEKTTGIMRWRLEKLLLGYTATEDETDVLTSALNQLHIAIHSTPKEHLSGTELILTRQYLAAQRKLIRYYRDHPQPMIDPIVYIRDHHQHLSAGELRSRLRSYGFNRYTVTPMLKEMGLFLVKRGGVQRYGVPNWNSAIKWLVDNLPPHTPTLLRELAIRSPFTKGTMRKTVTAHPHFYYNTKTKEITYEPLTDNT